MSPPTVSNVDAWEVLDSRGHPTVRVRVEAGNASGTFTVPAGASTGTHEAIERRDGNSRYGGLGVSDAVETICDDLCPIVVGRAVTEQGMIDAELVEQDGTDQLARFGANAILGVSGAVARAAANANQEPLYSYLAPADPGRLPLPMVNLLSGGLHAHGGISIQDILAIPLAAPSFTESLKIIWEVRNALETKIAERGVRPLVADEGGFSPPVHRIEDAFDLVIGAIREAGYDPSRDGVALAVDVAASHFRTEAGYHLRGDDQPLATDGLIDEIVEWIRSYPIVSIEDPLGEDDWEGWQSFADVIEGVQRIGDDFLVTDRKRLSRAIATDAVSGILVKPNQAGTITRTMDVIADAQANGISPVISARSGETCDSTIADLAVAVDAGQIKIGSLARSERLAKYNRLLEIEHRDDRGFVGSDPIMK